MRPGILPALALLIGTAATAGQSPEGKLGEPAPPAVRAERAYEKANALFEQHKLPECLAALEEALGADPKHVPALTLKAKIAIGVNRLDIAGQCLERAVAADPSSWYARFLYGFWYYLRDDWSHALAELEASRKLNPRYAHAPLYLGLTYERMGDPARAVTFAEEAIRVEEAAGTPNAESLLVYARLLQMLGRLTDCGKALNRALQLYSNSRDVHFAIARLLLRKGDAKGAANAAEEALPLPPGDVTDVQIRYLLVRAYSAAGQDQLAAAQATAIRAAEAQDGK
jgi:tetratricopeptide (TPR) repeat protein